jgi:hypothetical protein
LRREEVEGLWVFVAGDDGRMCEVSEGMLLGEL